MAMIFGILELKEGEKFSTDKHLDLSKCTVIIDAWFTNKTMFQYATSDWDKIRQLVQQVSLNHWFWRIDLSVGNTM